MWGKKKGKCSSRCTNGDNVRVGNLCCGEVKVLFDGCRQLQKKISNYTVKYNQTQCLGTYQWWKGCFFKERYLLACALQNTAKQGDILWDGFERTHETLDWMDWARNAECNVLYHAQKAIIKPNHEKKNTRPYWLIGLRTGTARAFLFTGLIAGAL